MDLQSHSMGALGIPLLSKSTQSTAASTLGVTSTTGDLVVDLTVCKLVDLVVVLVAQAGLVGEAIDFWEDTMSASRIEQEANIDIDLRVWAWPETAFSAPDCCPPPELPPPLLPPFPRASLALLMRLDIFGEVV